MYICRICANEFEESLGACPYCGCPPGFPLPPKPVAEETRYHPMYVKNLRCAPPAWVYLDSMEENKVFLRVIPEGEKGAELMGRLEKIRKSALSIFPAITEIRMPSEEAEGFYAYVAPDGSTLAEHLERERPLELAKAIRVEEKLWDAYEKMSSMGIRHGTLNPYLIYLDGEEIVLDYFEANAAEEDDQARIRQILNGLKEGGCLQTGEFQTDRSMAGRFRRFFQTLRG